MNSKKLRSYYNLITEPTNATSRAPSSTTNSKLLATNQGTVSQFTNASLDASVFVALLTRPPLTCGLYCVAAGAVQVCGSDGRVVSMAVPSEGWYGVPRGLVFSLPCIVSNEGVVRASRTQTRSAGPLELPSFDTFLVGPLVS